MDETCILCPERQYEKIETEQRESTVDNKVHIIHIVHIFPVEEAGFHETVVVPVLSAGSSLSMISPAYLPGSSLQMLFLRLICREAFFR